MLIFNYWLAWDINTKIEMPRNPVTKSLVPDHRARHSSNQWPASVSDALGWSRVPEVDAEDLRGAMWERVSGVSHRCCWPALGTVSQTPQHFEIAFPNASERRRLLVPLTCLRIAEQPMCVDHSALWLGLGIITGRTDVPRINLCSTIQLIQPVWVVRGNMRVQGAP